MSRIKMHLLYTFYFQVSKASFSLHEALESEFLLSDLQKKILHSSNISISLIPVCFACSVGFLYLIFFLIEGYVLYHLLLQHSFVWSINLCPNCDHWLFQSSYFSSNTKLFLLCIRQHHIHTRSVTWGTTQDHFSKNRRKGNNYIIVGCAVGQQVRH